MPPARTPAVVAAPTQRRGEELRRHILLTAKDVFIELGFERGSMDLVAARASTSKRSLYAFFQSKETLFAGALDLIRELYLDQLRTPDAYSDDPTEAVALFCARFLQLMVWLPQARTCRLCIAEAERLPRSSADYFAQIFGGTRDRLAAFLTDRLDRDADRAAALAGELLERAVLPRLFRTLLGVERPIRRRGSPRPGTLEEDVDVDAIRAIVVAAIAASQGRNVRE